MIINPIGKYSHLKVIIDENMFETLRKHTWYSNPEGYIFTMDGKKRIFLHRMIVDCPAHLEVDHINRNPLDNRKVNLRVATRSQNLQNRTSKKDAFTSNYKGVSWDKTRTKWRATIQLDKKSKTIGRFRTEKEAALAYNEKAKELHGEFAYLNTIEGE